MKSVPENQQQMYHGTKHNVGFRMLLECEREAFDKLIGEVPCPEFNRVGTYSICSLCNKCYVDHPYLIPHYFLNLLCDGRVVKL